MSQFFKSQFSKSQFSRLQLSWSRRHTILIRLTIYAVACILGQARAARAQDHTDLQQWTIITVDATLPHRLRAYFEAQPRLISDVHNVGRLLIRPAFGYQINPKTSVWLGYAWTPLFSPGYTDEHRIFQQLLIEDKFRQWDVTNRTRLEQRFISGASDTALRFRHMLQVSHPLTRDGRWYIVGFDELFLNLNTVPHGPSSGLDQNRLYGGIGRVLAPGVKGELGYMLNTVSPPRGEPDMLNHVIYASLGFSL